MQIQTLSPFYVLSLPLIQPITLTSVISPLPALFSSLMHFSLSLIYFLFHLSSCACSLLSPLLLSVLLYHIVPVSIILLVLYLCNSFFHLKLSFLMFDKAG